MAHCKITDLHYDDTPGGKRKHRELLQKASSGGLPAIVREAMKDAGWAVFKAGANGRIMNPDRRAALLMICYAYWARAKEFGISDDNFEEYMLDRIFFVETLDKDQKAAQARIRKWGKYEG